MRPPKRWLLATPLLLAVVLLLATLSPQEHSDRAWDSGDYNRVIAHSDVGPGPWSSVNATLIDPGDLPRLAASQPALYGGLSPSGLYLRVELRGNESTRLVIYDARAERVERVFRLVEGALLR